MVAAVFTGGDRFGPATHVVERFFGEATQRGIHARAVSELGVEELLAGPGRFAEMVQADHAAAALEGVESAPHHRHLVAGIGCESAVRAVSALVHRVAGVFQDLTRFFDEDLAHLAVVFEPGATGRCGPRWWHGCRRWQRQRQCVRRGQREQAL